MKKISLLLSINMLLALFVFTGDAKAQDVGCPGSTITIDAGLAVPLSLIGASFLWPDASTGRYYTVTFPADGTSFIVCVEFIDKKDVVGSYCREIFGAIGACNEGGGGCACGCDFRNGITPDGTKITICHRDGSGNLKPITVDFPSLPAHIAHGDTSICGCL